MSEFDRLMQRIEDTKKKGENRLYLEWELEYETIQELRDMGYLVLQTFSDNYIDTVIGWKA